MAIMDLFTSLQTIVNERLAKDVRQAIHDGVYRANQVADENKDLVDRVAIRQDAVEQYNNQMIAEMTDKDVISAPELVESRVDPYGISSDKLSERLNRETIGAFADTQTQLTTLANRSNLNTIIINKPITIDDSITLPSGKIIRFENGGRLIIGDGVELKVNSTIEAGRVTIFEFGEDSYVTTDAIRFGQVESSTNIKQDVYPEWFGAVADAYPSLGYLYADLSTAHGTDNTESFKRCMRFAESASAVSAVEPNRSIHPSVTVSLAPNGVYYVAGDNPLGVQSNEVDQGYSVNLNGNGATLIWEPVEVDDAIFNKYGRIIKPQIHDLNVVLVGAKGQRKGSFINTSTGEGDTYHLWNGGHLSHLNLGTHSSVGFDTIFNITPDAVHSHDDLTRLEHVSTGSYNTFINFANNEAVDWLIEKVFFNSQTEGATHIKIGSGFSGGLTLNSCEILLRENNETFIEAGSSISKTPIRVINGRMETRNDFPMTFLKAESGKFVINNLQMDAANSSVTPNTNTRLVKLGKSAYAKFEDSALFDQSEVELSNASPHTDVALDFLNCRFIGSIGNLGNTLSFFAHPQITYIYGTSSGNLVDAMRSGYVPRRVSVDKPSFAVGGLLLPIEYSSRRLSKSSETYKIFKRASDGKPTLDIQNINDLPPEIVVTSLKLTVGLININNVDEIRVVFYNRSDPGNDNSQIVYNLTSNADIKGVDILGNSHVYLPKRSYIHVTCRKGGATVSAESLLPTAWIDMSYRSVESSIDSGSVSGLIARQPSLGK